MSVKSGVPRLDELLRGGFPDNSNILIYGAPFTGKAEMILQFILQGLAEGVPGIIVSTDKTASDIKADLARIDPGFQKYDDDGLVHYIDVYSVSIGSEQRINNAEYVDSPVNLNAMALAMNKVQDKLKGKYERHCIAFNSISTLVTYTNPVTTFRFIQILSGKCKRLGATTLHTLEEGMHEEMEVQMFKHLTDGVIELKENEKDLKTYLHVQGMGEVVTRDWVEYKNSSKGVELVGSFSTGRIR
ncbi:MAG: hypothetical protein CVT48_02150 [Thermoplasmata archaeon HGW-Thermoplasmata-1]|nr:MAG: hypothetical protein CVT48_02150 [Thermoplasmata archaeon HGW-Thermoplasmata-1]